MALVHCIKYRLDVFLGLKNRAAADLPPPPLVNLPVAVEFRGQYIADVFSCWILFTRQLFAKYFVCSVM